MSKTRDPVCGAAVDSQSAKARVVFRAQEYLFCSDTCLRTFQSDPEMYAEKLERHEPPFTVSKKGFVAPKFGAAGSGGLEYEPIPEQHDDKE